MKITQSKSVLFKPTWGGNLELPPEQQFALTLKPLNRAQYFGAMNEMLSISQKQKDSSTEDDEDKQALVKTNIDKMSDDQRRELAKYALETSENVAAIYTRFGLSSNVVAIHNLTINEQPASVEQLIEEPIFAGLIVELTSKLIEISNISEIDAKN